MKPVLPAQESLMSKKKNRRSAVAKPAVSTPATEASPPAAAPAKAQAPAGKSGTGKMAVVIALTFVAAFALAWLLFGNTKPPAQTEPEAPPAKVIGEAEVKEFLAAVEAEDFAAMTRIGSDLFKKGDKIPDRTRLFGDHAVESFPPFQVYAFMTHASNKEIRRVLLTIDENDQVESFMAEEMPVVQ